MAVRESPVLRWSRERIRKDANLLVRLQQRLRSPGRDAGARGAAALGGETAFTLGLPLLAWSLPQLPALLVILAWSATFVLGHALKCASFALSFPLFLPLSFSSSSFSCGLVL